jgi:hypothetical protein
MYRATSYAARLSHVYPISHVMILRDNEIYTLCYADKVYLLHIYLTYI